MDAIPAVEFVQGDFSSDEAFAEFLSRLGTDRTQLVMPDRAPNTSGMADVDHAPSMHLVELALDFAQRSLTPNGEFLTKVFQPRESESVMKTSRAAFGTVKVRKPSASQPRSSELYLLARNFRL